MKFVSIKLDNQNVMKKIYVVLILLLVIGGTVCSYIFKSKTIESFFYDLKNDNQQVLNLNQLKNSISYYSVLNYNQLPEALKSRMKSAEIDYKNKFSKLNFYKIPKDDLYKKVYMNQRLIDICSSEQRELYLWFSSTRYFYIMVNFDLFDVLFRLNSILNKKGFFNENIKINSAYRSPNTNDKVHGARNSMHLFGKALDLKIGDINKDGLISEEDKKIVYDILDKNLIKNKGGLGYYPKTMILHIDIRGSRARWDQYKRK